jgi:hypothetical protein
LEAAIAHLKLEPAAATTTKGLAEDFLDANAEGTSWR